MAPLYRMHCLYMLDELVFPRVRSRAQIALIRLAVGMREQMSRQIVPRRVALHADAACRGVSAVLDALYAVRLHVPRQFVAPGERFAAYFARVGLEAGVRQRVAHQFAPLVEPFVANGADEVAAFARRVGRRRVTAQLFGVVEHFAASLALEMLYLRKMNVSVNREIWVSGNAASLLIGIGWGKQSPWR